MKLANFIVDNIDAILGHWETFARSLPPGRSMTVQALRNDAERMLRFVAADMGTSQSRDEQTAKGRGHGPVLPFGEHSAAHEHGVQRAAEGFSLIEMVSEYRALRASVTRLWQDAAVAQGDPSGASGALLELTRFHEAIDQILAESVARFSAKLEYDRDMFLAILGHDLRNPLQAIALSADAMTRARALSPSEQAELGRRIAISSARAQRLVQDLTEFARGRLGPSPALSMQQCNIQHVVQEAIDELRRAYPDRVFDYATSGDGLAQWDAARIQQMASNVIANAAQYGRPGTPVLVSVQAENDHISLSVRSIGEPIPEDQRATLFDPLRRGSSSPEPHQRHLGLGLYIARTIARQHGGDLELTSSDENGTVFTARLARRTT